MGFEFTLSEELLKLQQRAHEEFTAIRGRYQELRANEIQKNAFEDVWIALAKLGFLGCLVPEGYGGNGFGLLAASVIMEELAAHSLHSFSPILASMGSSAMARFGTEGLKKAFLPRITRGELKLAIASTEIEAGFNVFDMRTFADNRGDHFIVNGSKIYISGADIADYMLMVARTMTREDCEGRGLSKTAGISVLLVDPRSAGIELAPVPSRGEEVLTQFALRLKDVHVPVSQLIGEEHQGARVMFQMFNPERILAAAMGLGMSRYCLNLACEHARTRQVFGQTPIGAYQSIQHPLAELAIRQESVRLMVYRSAWLFDKNGEARQLSEAANSAKYLSAELAVKAVDTAIYTFGGKGFDEDKGIIHLWEGARLLKTAPISDALILNQIAEYGLKLPRSY